MSDSSREMDRGSGVKLDLTLNIPTLLSIVAMVAGSITYINGQINAINNQQLVTVGDVKVLQTQMSANQQATSSLRNDTSAQLTLFRSEIRSDLRDLKEGVDRLNQQQNRGR